MKMAEDIGVNVIKTWAEKFIKIIMGRMEEYVRKGYEITSVSIEHNTKQEAIADIAKFISLSYIHGHASIKEETELDHDKLSLWATKKAIMIVKKIEMDMLYRVVMEVYDAEVAH